jgi:chromosome segregation ATPase
MTNEIGNSSAARAALRDAETELTNAEECARAIRERALQIGNQLDEVVQRLEESEAVREEILQAMLFDASAQDALDQYNEERTRMQREIADFRELNRKAAEAATRATERVRNAHRGRKYRDELFKQAVYVERCERIRSLISEDLEVAALALVDTISGLGVDIKSVAWKRLAEELLPHALFRPNEQQREVVLARMLAMPE